MARKRVGYYSAIPPLAFLLVTVVMNVWRFGDASQFTRCSIVRHRIFLVCRFWLAGECKARVMKQ
jgi:hypothetical protein